jgi:hypothetical protein
MIRALLASAIVGLLSSPAGAAAESDALQGAEVFEALLKDESDFADRLRVAGIFQACLLSIPDELLLPLIPAAERRVIEMFPQAETNRVLMVVFAVVSGFQTGMAEGIAAGFRAGSVRDSTCKLASERAAELSVTR